MSFRPYVLSRHGVSSTGHPFIDTSNSLGSVSVLHFTGNIGHFLIRKHSAFVERTGNAPRVFLGFFFIYRLHSSFFRSFVFFLFLFFFSLFFSSFSPSPFRLPFFYFLLLTPFFLIFFMIYVCCLSFFNYFPMMRRTPCHA